jgi:6-phosphogluconolactonase
MLKIVDDERALAAAAAEEITTRIEHAMRERQSAVVALTGGASPRLLYRYLGDPMQPWRQRIDWSRLQLCWGDERHVPPDHAESNFGMAEEALINHVPIPASHVHRMRGELINANEAAREYESELDAAFSEAGRSDHTFDVMLLGLGENSHIASIFPGSPLLADYELRTRNPNHPELGTVNRPNVEPGTGNRERRSVAAVLVPELKAWRITLTPAAILDSRSIVMIVAGAAKADAVWWALEGPEQIDQHPVQLLRAAADRVEWIIDRPAAGRLRAAPRG